MREFFIKLLGGYTRESFKRLSNILDNEIDFRNEKINQYATLINQFDDYKNQIVELSRENALLKSQNIIFSSQIAFLKSVNLLDHDSQGNEVTKEVEGFQPISGRTSWTSMKKRLESTDRERYWRSKEGQLVSEITNHPEIGNAAETNVRNPG